MILHYLYPIKIYQRSQSSKSASKKRNSISSHFRCICRFDFVSFSSKQFPCILFHQLKLQFTISSFSCCHRCLYVYCRCLYKFYIKHSIDNESKIAIFCTYFFFFSFFFISDYCVLLYCVAIHWILFYIFFEKRKSVENKYQRRTNV